MRGYLGRRSVATALAVLVGLTVAPLAASPAQADVSLVSVALTLNPLILDGDTDCGNWVTLTAKVYDPEGDGDDVVFLDADVYTPSGTPYWYVSTSQSSRSGDYAYYRGYVYLCGLLNTPGRYTVRTRLRWWDEQVNSHTAQRSDAFSIMRPTSLTYDASPEPVRKNGTLTHKGVLKADPVGLGPKKGLKGAVLKFYFKADGATGYTYKGKVTTGAGGKYSKKFKATNSGLWKVVYAGSATRQPQTKYDAVKVK